jgi:hypothetical protein
MRERDMGWESEGKKGPVTGDRRTVADCVWRAASTFLGAKLIWTLSRSHAVNLAVPWMASCLPESRSKGACLREFDVDRGAPRLRLSGCQGHCRSFGSPTERYLH